MSDLIALLTEQGFVEDTAAFAAHVVSHEAAGVNDGGNYTLQHLYVKGEVRVHVEQNDATEDIGGMSAVVSHPPVAVLETPKGRVAFNPTDVELAGALLSELS